MNTILVTGGAGFIGSHVCEKLLSHGFHVVCLDSFNNFYNPTYKEKNIQDVLKGMERIEQVKPNGCRFTLERGDIRDKEKLEQIFTTYAFDGVVHLAAYAGVRPSIEQPELYFDVNVNGTLNILEVMRRHQVKSLVFASSSSVYGNNEKVPFAETDRVDNPISPYAATKKAGELMCHTWHHLHGFSVACLRFFTVYGPRQRPDLAIRKFSEMMLRDEVLPVFGDGSTERDYTFISDIVGGVEKALFYVMGMLPVGTCENGVLSDGGNAGLNAGVTAGSNNGVSAVENDCENADLNNGENADLNNAENAVYNDGVTTGYNVGDGSEHKPVYDIFNLGESQTISLNRMIAGIESALGMKAEIKRLPEQAGDVKRTFADITKARRVLGYAPVVKYEDGVKAFVKWLEEKE